VIFSGFVINSTITSQWNFCQLLKSDNLVDYNYMHITYKLEIPKLYKV